MQNQFQDTTLIKALIDLGLQSFRQSQINIQQSSSDIGNINDSLVIQLQDSDYINQTHSPEHYVQTAIKYLQHYQQFSQKINSNTLNSFLTFYYQYQQLLIISKDNIKNQVSKLLNQQNDTSLIQQILIADSALYHTTKSFRLRITQLMTIYCFLINQKYISRILLQVLTGEGKSTTIACLAAVLYLRGHCVDIITTNIILAKRDVQEKKYFFQLLEIQVSHNFSSQNQKNNQVIFKPKSCYLNRSIVYGIPSSFQVDLLFDEYKKKNTRNGRPYDVVIIDQVDSMFIDQKSHQTLLSTTFAGYSDLILPMRILWQTIVMHNIVRQGDNFMLYKNGKAEGSIIKGEVNQVMRAIIDDLRKKFKNQIIPKQKLKFIEISLENWIWSAIEAAHIYKQNQHYVIQNGQIVPVDFRNTGCLQKNVQWQRGLHQFLQMKHGLKVSVESMTSNFISNIGHFQRYKFIYGLTGTLGSNQSKRFLNTTYSAEIFEIPSFYQRRLQTNPGYFMYSQKNWSKKILQRVQIMIEKQRACLIICQTIHHANILKDYLIQNKLAQQKIRTYLSGQEKHSDIVDCGQIIIATNIAGRGTDLKITKQLLKYGGLHVIITFMPQNLRVQMQARGRAGRNGAPGSSELIVNHKQYFSENRIKLIDKDKFEKSQYENRIPYIYQKVRDPIEAKSMKNDLKKVQTLKIKDRNFQNFCKVVNSIPDFHENQAKRNAIEQQWAMFLRKAQHLSYTNKQFDIQSQALINKFSKDSQQFYNINHNIWRGLNEINKGNFNESKKYFQQLQSEQASTIQKVSGILYESAADINDSTLKSSSSTLAESIKKMSGVFEFLDVRKDMVKGAHALSLCTNNRTIVNIMQGQKERETKRMKQLLEKSLTSTQFKVIELQQINILKLDEKQQAQQLMKNQQLDLIQSIEEHIQAQFQIMKNIKQGESITIRLQPLRRIIDVSQDKDTPDQAAVQKMITNLPYLPVAQITKIQVCFWNRAFVFAIGVLQVCVGALIITYSSGVTAPFGAYMIQCGLKDCMTQYFSPQVCKDLQKFFSKKSIEYAMSLATIGLDGISQLAILGQKGFEIIEKQPMSDVMKKATQGIKKGLIKGGFDWKAIAKTYIFQGLSQKLGITKIINNNNNETQKFKILAEPMINTMVKNGYKQQKQIEEQIYEIYKKLKLKVTQKLNQLIQQGFKIFLWHLMILKQGKQIVQLFVNKAFDLLVEIKFNIQRSSQSFSQMIEFFKKNLTNGDLAINLIQKFQIKEFVINVIKKIKQGDDYMRISKKGQLTQNLLKLKIQKKFDEIKSVHKKELNIKFQLLKKIKYQLENDPLTLVQRNQKMKQFTSIKSIYEIGQQKYNKFINQCSQLLKKSSIISYMNQLGVIEGKQLSKDEYKLEVFGDIMIQVLRQIQYPEMNNKLKNDFIECLSTRVYNSFMSMAMRALCETLNDSSRRLSLLRTIQGKVYDGIECLQE